MNMIPILSRRLSMAVLAAATLTLALDSHADTHAKYKVNVPPSADLHYSIKALQKGIPVEGDATVHWTVSGDKFVATNEARAMIVGKILDARTEGTLDDDGLAPSTFTEKRFRKQPSTTTFDRSDMKISFTASDQVYPIEGGEQDRNSIIWQLVSVARAAPKNLRPGAAWTFAVAGQRDVDEWTFHLSGQEKIQTPQGTLNTWHITRATPPDSKEQRLDIWLAPAMEWYPVRLRFSDDNGDFIEQTLQSVSKKEGN